MRLTLLALRLLLVFFLPPKLGFCPIMAAEMGSSQEVVGEPASDADIVAAGAGRRVGAPHPSMKHEIHCQDQAITELGPGTCWLCKVAGGELALVTYKSFEVHVGCKSALRCNDRILGTSTPTAKAADAKLQQQNLSCVEEASSGVPPPRARPSQSGDDVYVQRKP